MGFAMLLALPAMLFAGSFLDVLTADDTHAEPADDHTARIDGSDTPHGDLLDPAEGDAA